MKSVGLASLAPLSPLFLTLIVLLLPPPAVSRAQQEEEREAGKREVELKGGLRYVDLVEGEGEEVRRSSTVSVLYTGWLEDGTEFDSNRGGAAMAFPLGQGRVIRGWELGLVGMKVGGVRRLIVPPKMGYGRAGVPGRIPPNATLIFEIELLGVR